MPVDIILLLVTDHFFTLPSLRGSLGIVNVKTFYKVQIKRITDEGGEYPDYVPAIYEKRFK